METLNLKVEKHVYGSQEFTTRLHYEYHVVDSRGNRFNAPGLSLSQFEAIDSALHHVLLRSVRRGTEASVTIAGATLSESLQEFLRAKYEIEEQIESITFE